MLNTAKKVILKNKDGEWLIPYTADTLKKNQITNCLLEVPQRIKLELNNGTLTLKAGSEVIVPNGFEEDGITPRFDYVTVESDISYSGTINTSASRKSIWSLVASDTSFTSEVALEERQLENIQSGTSTPSTAIQYYNTNENLIYFSGTTTQRKSSLPICMVTIDSAGVIVSLDQTFNGMGYIGSTVWVDKGVKGLIPNGRNEDGTLKNIEWTSSKIYLSGNSNPNINFCDIIYDLTGDRVNKAGMRYNISEDGYIYNNLGELRVVLPLGTYSSDSNDNITSFQPKLPVNLATKDMVDGQWGNGAVSLLSNVSITSSYRNSIDLSNFLPNDGYAYEIMLNALVITGATSGNLTQIIASSSICPAFHLAQCLTRTSATNQISGTTTMPIGTDRVLNISGSGTSGTGKFSLYVRNYRRIGTNV